MKEAELITIIEGPTPDFQPSPQAWLQSIYEGPEDKVIAVCQLRTMNGEGIQARSQRAWGEGRPVRLDYPDELRMRRQVDVVALRLQEIDEGPLLQIWVSLPLELVEEEEEGFDEGDDDSFFLS
ncbi:MAG: hypothetical protein AAF614_38340 [Chloroflexota bacterium]